MDLKNINAIVEKRLEKKDTGKEIAHTVASSCSEISEEKILKPFLLMRLHQLFFELFNSKISHSLLSMECYLMDNKIMQLIILDLIETGDYTLEGIAYHTRIPFDVIYDVACGITRHFSITPWVRIVELYLQVKPEVGQKLTNKFLEINENNSMGFKSLLHYI